MKYFWLEKHLNQWRETIAADRKPQAVIVSGVEGMGKAELLNMIVADLLCRQSTPACGTCQNCRLYAQNYHPDVDRLIPEKALIKVKMIRELTSFFVSTPHCSDHKIAIIEDAHLMNTAAANALLKVLEEPPSRGLLFLVTDSKHKLMPTIRSRCITLDVVMSQEERKQLHSWISQQDQFTDEQIGQALMLADWQPLVALKILENQEVDAFSAFLDQLVTAFSHKEAITVAAKNMADVEDAAIWEYLNQYVNQLLKSIISEGQPTDLFNHPLNQLVKKSPKVFNFAMKFSDKIKLIMLNLNTQIKKQLLIESMLTDLKNELNG